MSQACSCNRNTKKWEWEELNVLVKELCRATLGGYFTEPDRKVVEKLNCQKPADQINDTNEVMMEINIPLDRFNTSGQFPLNAVVELLTEIYNNLPGHEDGMRESIKRDYRRAVIKEFQEKYC